ncbi:LipA and NB-ARC domain protein [Metarhizium rileyi]|uniref:Riboflavin kinase n=1 Tax=Metarhizium rileyi (strain RCEF 4871) TaxID=1649241 RepID=A0A167JHQ8_METRR|nr:LipA and NB-ARC domain protein [Metarhizium rileyi RCEF 4871]
MEDVCGWRPPAGLHVEPAKSSASPLQHSPRSPLRSSRSVTNLGLPVVHDRPPLPTTTTIYKTELLLPSPPPYEIRRVRSSSALPSANVSSGTAAATTAAEQNAPSKFKAAVENMQFAAGGLIGKAVESNKHYSVIRHSGGLVWYRGPDTSVSMTILSDAPLPSNRTVWLQQKGHSGNVGMAFKAMVSSRGSWIDVTPAQEAQVKHVKGIDERGMQRDMDRFAAKASGRAKRHVPRETHLVRVPAAASDGYYRLVVCGGQDAAKVLCECAVFRVASLSENAAVVRGASLSTLPLEMTIKVATVVGTQVVKKYTGVAGAVVQNRAGSFMAKRSGKRVAVMAAKGYHGLGRAGIQDAMQDSWKRQRAAASVEFTSELVVTLIGSDEGPEKPFPVRFQGTITRGTGSSAQDLGFPTANLADVPDRIKTSLSGVFAAWTKVLPSKKNTPDGPSPAWHPAVVSIAPPRGAAPSIASPSGVRVHILYNFGTTFFTSKLDVLLMGWMHPAAPPTTPDAEVISQHEQDITTTLASLERQPWSADEAVSRMKTAKSERSLSDRLDEATGLVYQTVDRIPWHCAAVRSESGTLKDHSYGIGGMWIRRD